jgi:cell division protein FtsW
MARPTRKEPLGSPDWVLLGAAAGLCAVGLMLVYSASFDIGFHLIGDSAWFFKRQALWMVIGAAAMILVSQFHYRHWMKLSIPLMFLAISVLIVLAVSGDRLLLDQSVSPVELAKLTVVVYIGHWLASKRVEQLRRLPLGLLPFTIIVGVVAGLIIVQPDLSEAVLIVLVALAMFFLAGADLLQFIIGFVGGGAAFVIVVSRIPYAMERILPHINEWRDPLHSSNDQLRQGLTALGAGGLFGVGPGYGRMKYQWLPAAHTDSIFAIMGEEMGLVGCLFLIALFALVAYRGLRIAEGAPDSFGRLLALGITCWISLQTLINMAVVTGTIPYTGIALPFISVGGSSLVTCLIGIGIMLSISRASNVGESRLPPRTSWSSRRNGEPDGSDAQKTWASQHRGSNLELET